MDDCVCFYVRIVVMVPTRGPHWWETVCWAGRSIPTAFPFASLNYLSPFLPPNCSTPVGQMGIEAGSHCCCKIGSCCLLRSLWNCISVWRLCFQKKLLLYCFSYRPHHKRSPVGIYSFFFRIYNNFVQQQLRVERKSINCALSPSRPSAQVPESQ